MKLTVIAPFHDKDSYSTVYNVGQVVEFETERALSVVERGLATPFEEADDTKEDVVEEKEQEVQPSAEEPTEESKEETEQESVATEGEEKPKRGRGRNKKD